MDPTTSPPTAPPSTTYVIADPCIGHKDRACVTACPVDCIHEVESQLFIDPKACVACGACVPACPYSAVFPIEEVPTEWKASIDRNRHWAETHHQEFSPQTRTMRGFRQEALG